ncbi:MAG: tetratricopeptide repeat protein [Bacteroidetes bacterium]|nr:tetratricopeptide repeat protein [Bacteroidota bacterium]MBL6944347.1 tetratricopeptide repeat protein [Bacteroidales bacterium]
MTKHFFVTVLLAVAVFFGCDNSNQKKQLPNEHGVDSISIISELLLNDSLNASLLGQRAELFFQKGNIDPALRDLQFALELSPNNPKLFILLSDIYFVLGQTDNSIVSLKKAIKLNPDDENPYLKLSETYIILDNPITAIKYADEAIKINRQNPESYYVKAMGLLENNDTAAAILNLKISTNLDSNNYMAFMQLGAIYTTANNALSFTYFNNALRAVPDDERALYFIGMYHQEHGEFEKAIERFSRITELYAGNKRAYYNMGYIYLVEMEDFEKAKFMFEKAVSINPRFVEAVYNLGRTMEAMGDYNGAREQYKKSLELLPNYPLAVQSMNRLDDLLLRKN